MKKVNQIVLMITAVLAFTISSCTAQKIANTKTETVKVYGNCDKCKKNIETAANKKGTSKAVWDKNNKTAVLTYDSTKTTDDAILKNIALAGYDNEKYVAPVTAYNKLDECCQYARPEKKTDVTTTTQTVVKDTTVKTNTVVTQTVKPLADVYAAYFSLKDALTKDDGTTAAAKAKLLYNAIDKVKMESMTSTEHTAWMNNMQAISYNAEHIKGTTDNEHQREHFAKLSAAMYQIMKVIKPDYNVYYDHCPMYNSGKGADWLSTESKIVNPYFGSQMIGCGSTKETIK